MKLIALTSLCLILALPSEGEAASRRLEKKIQKVEEVAPNYEKYFANDAAAVDRKANEESTGSLWSSNYSSHLYDNMYRASRPGDTVTIVVDEHAQGTGKGDTKTNRKMDHAASIDQLGGLMGKLQTLISGLDPTKLLKAKTESKFQGDGATKREGSLEAKITATIERVLKNGNMVIRGEQHLKINKEEQVLIVEGIIRPYDIQPDNTVLSSALADARISYNGFGVIGERQSPGWLVRVLDHVWPF